MYSMDKSPYIRYWLIGWVCNAMSFACYFFKAPLFGLFGAWEDHLYYIVSQSFYYGSIIIICTGILKYYGKKTGKKWILLYSGMLFYMIIINFTFPDIYLRFFPLAITAGAIFSRTAYYVFRRVKNRNIYLRLLCITLALWGLSIIIYPLMYKRPAHMSFFYLLSGAAGLLLMIDLIIIYFANINASVSRQKTEIEYLTYYEIMTGLYNRNYFIHFILDNNRSDLALPLCFVLFDLDGLKTINDNLGHSEGDKLIIRFADILKESLRGNDIAARIGGDEFILVLPDTEKEEAEKIVKRILAAAAKNKNMPLLFSYGISQQNSLKDTQEQLFREADMGMYLNKKARQEESKSVLAEFIKNCSNCPPAQIKK